MVPPNVRDARLHTAAVIITIHVLGITALGFKVSIPQILSAIVASALIDVLLTFRKTRMLVWPASGMLTGSGVALILRLNGMRPHDYWSWRGWYVFAGVAAVSLLTKYVIRFRGDHVFNPSNVGLVAAFLLLGSRRIEPLDFWWSPLNFWMVLAYLVLMTGGILITRRLGLLSLALTAWAALALGLAVLAGSGHCITAAWSALPVCGASFWRIVVLSPELIIFVFLMITDPKTIPRGSMARLVFAMALATVSVLLMAPQTNEFGAKVGLLAGLVVLTPLRWSLDRLIGDQRGDVGRKIASWVAGPSLRVFARGLLIGICAAVLAMGVVAAGSPARLPATAEVTDGGPVIVEVDPESLPVVEVDASVDDLIDRIDPDAVALILAENLALEGQAILEADSEVLSGADGGPRLEEMTAAVGDAVATGRRSVDEYRLEVLSLRVQALGAGQGGAGLAFDTTAEVTTVVYDAEGRELTRTQSDFTGSFLLGQVGGDRWLILEMHSSG